MKEIIIIYEIVFLKKLTLPFCTHSMSICFEKTILFTDYFFKTSISYNIMYTE